ncbi:hypothetical protein FHW96_003526 [Novosphingobium sp. SG751A]|uniref:hypothetical protein n=1 Tax=Novosphingobium sp. SG751A TaxID=2587000 RepID=UPI001551C398|nr:hypothetical protein [Novosphingobium sp. SG751A]NOW47348.1 hypothetical protein [Novosphingobium sp. SG751A]
MLDHLRDLRRKATSLRLTQFTAGGGNVAHLSKYCCKLKSNGLSVGHFVNVAAQQRHALRKPMQLSQELSVAEACFATNIKIGVLFQRSIDRFGLICRLALFLHSSKLEHL